MKISHLALSVVLALGLTACGPGGPNNKKSSTSSSSGFDSSTSLSTPRSVSSLQAAVRDIEERSQGLPDLNDLPDGVELPPVPQRDVDLDGLLGGGNAGLDNLDDFLNDLQDKIDAVRDQIEDLAANQGVDLADLQDLLDRLADVEDLIDGLVP